MTSSESFATAATVALKRYEQARDKFAIHMGEVMDLTSEKPIQKDAAIRRIMEATGASYSAAERTVEADPQYQDFLSKLVVETMKREVEYGRAEAAKMQHATALALLALAPVKVEAL